MVDGEGKGSSAANEGGGKREVGGGCGNLARRSGHGCHGIGERLRRGKKLGKADLCTRCFVRVPCTGVRPLVT